MRKYYIGLLSFSFAAISHAENAIEASVAALPPVPFFLDQPVRAFALVLGVVLVAITFYQALFRKHPDAMVKVKVSKD